ncbi:PREDICTED: nucleoside diphosphate kinase homolog 5 [Rhagoletis zephyria]|uniref:nucleoside diphosphate kinase homolog 5 n=1 Tax=Rhagoletis zephyria TaxID=28612 RepID=UPI000811A230|nr:PREDICTED: nucleoside diphosphate kinase homolog 5 [Rhagoletis zephyria]
MSTMFEDTLLIIKADYMHKRKPVLLHLLQHEFLIKGQRKILFSPENAAEFYKSQAEDKDFMLQVILLSKGISEAFILAKENAVEGLICTMICYFSTSMEMVRNVHVSTSTESAAREISFIFVNYIPEPIPLFKRHKFSSDSLMAPFISQLYEIIQKPDDEKKSWKVQLAEWLTLENPELPIMSNTCSTRAEIFVEDKTQQVNLVDSTGKKPCVFHTDGAGGETASSDVTCAPSSSSTGNSIVMSSSSCMTCCPFERTEVDVTTEDVCNKSGGFSCRGLPYQNALWKILAQLLLN